MAQDKADTQPLLVDLTGLEPGSPSINADNEYKLYNIIANYHNYVNNNNCGILYMSLQ